METRDINFNPQARFFSNHTLDISNVEAVANQVATKLKLNVSYQDADNDLKQVIVNNESDFFLKLYSEINGTSVYIIEIGESAIVISNEIIEYDVPHIEIFDVLKAKHSESKGGLGEKFLYGVMVNELLALSANEVLVVKDHHSINEETKHSQTFEQFKDSVAEVSEYFIITKPKKFNFL